jgi:hypothetical protein
MVKNGNLKERQKRQNWKMLHGKLKMFAGCVLLCLFVDSTEYVKGKWIKSFKVFIDKLDNINKELYLHTDKAQIPLYMFAEGTA